MKKQKGRNLLLPWSHRCAESYKLQGYYVHRGKTKMALWRGAFPELFFYSYANLWWPETFVLWWDRCQKCAFKFPHPLGCHFLSYSHFSICICPFHMVFIWSESLNSNGDVNSCVHYHGLSECAQYQLIINYKPLNFGPKSHGKVGIRWWLMNETHSPAFLLNAFYMLILCILH